MNADIISATALIVSGYAARNSVDPDLVAGLIPKVAAALLTTGAMDFIAQETGDPGPVLLRAPERDPAVPIEESVRDDHIVCLEDGTKLSCLTRYLKRRYGLSPDQYRERWGLPSDYPMTAPEYSRRRSEIARGIRSQRT